MSKTKSTDIISKAIESAVESLFKPTHDHRKAKSAFWHAVGEGLVPSHGPDTELLIAAKYANDSRIQQWWDLPGFIDWFLNREDFRQQAAYVGELSLSELEKILRSEWSKEKLPAIKLGLEVAGKLQKADSEPADNQIANMTKKQLEDYISKRQGLVARPEPPVVTAESDDDTN